MKPSCLDRIALIKQPRDAIYCLQETLGADVDASLDKGVSSIHGDIHDLRWVILPRLIRVLRAELTGGRRDQTD